MKWGVAILSANCIYVFTEKMSLMEKNSSHHPLSLFLFLIAISNTLQLDSLEMMPLDLFSPLLSDVLVNPVSWCVD